MLQGNHWMHSHFQLYAECLDCVVAENHFVDSFAASWGMNPHNLVGGWQPNMQVEWLRNTVTGGTGITLMTSTQPVRNGVVRHPPLPKCTSDISIYFGCPHHT